jgi:hypothetical protein
MIRKQAVKFRQMSFPAWDLAKVKQIQQSEDGL